MAFWQSFVEELPARILYSLVFLFVVLVLFKPRLRISPFVCKHPKDTPAYLIKIVNMSIFSAYDIKIELHSLERVSVPPKGMQNIKYEKLKVKIDHIFTLPPYRPSWLRKEALHAIRIKALEDLESIISQGAQSVEIQISARHGLTGLTKVFTQEYSDLSQVKSTNFTYGTKFNVL